jgi:hypothetical protein
MRDTGIGISAEQLPKLFNMCFQANAMRRYVEEYLAMGVTALPTGYGRFSIARAGRRSADVKWKTRP